MTTLNSRLQLALLNRKKGRNLIEKGFTLVELMIVIVIVGILSAVALPNFLSQTDKAKATEAKTVASSYLKQIYAAYQGRMFFPKVAVTVGIGFAVMAASADSGNDQRSYFQRLDQQPVKAEMHWLG